MATNADFSPVPIQVNHSWSELVRDAICGKLDLQDAEDRARPFYRSLKPEQVTIIRSVIERLVNSKVWSAPAGDDVDRVLADNKSAVKDWLKQHGLSTGYLIGRARMTVQRCCQEST